MNNYTAIDFETATGYHNSICQVGLVRVENDKIVDELNLYVKPPSNYYWYKNIEVHGINSSITQYAPTFDRVWDKIRPFIEEKLIVAHNIGFDNSCLVKTLNLYNLEVPKYEKVCWKARLE